MDDVKKFFLKETDSIRTALQVIDDCGEKIAILVNEKKQFLGVVTDGDIRRGLLAGMKLEDGVLPIVNRKAVSARDTNSRDELIAVAQAKKVQQFPILNSEGIVLRVENLARLLSPEEKKNKVVLMAGGLGLRLRPLTETIPKPMLKVGNKPILETIIEGFRRHGFRDFIFCVSYMSHVIEEYFGDGSAWGVKIEYVHEPKKMGTAGALSLIGERLTEPFYVMNGDLITSVDFENFFRRHLGVDSIATMGVREYDFQVPYGVVNIDKGKITSIQEKPVHKFYVSAGIYMLSPQALKYVPHDQYFDMPSLFNTLVENNQSTSSYIIKEYWLDIGRMSDYERAQAEFVGEITSFGTEEES